MPTDLIIKDQGRLQAAPRKFYEKLKFLTRSTTIESHDTGRFCSIRTNVS